MNLIRSVMSVFLLIVLGVCAAGWFWAGEQKTQYAVVGARIAVGLCGLMAVGAIALIWREKSPASHGPGQ